jgi:hypothetical protein
MLLQMSPAAKTFRTFTLSSVGCEDTHHVKHCHTKYQLVVHNKAPAVPHLSSPQQKAQSTTITYLHENEAVGVALQTALLQPRVPHSLQLSIINTTCDIQIIVA